MIGIIDYGMGNLRSVQKAVEFLGGKAVITADKAELDKCGRLILPGVGSFAAGMENLRRAGLVSALRAEERPLLGICLGMQFLFDLSLEGGRTPGLGLLPGTVEPIPRQTPKGEPLRVPHIGWSALCPATGRSDFSSSALEAVPSMEQVYFVHGYQALPAYPPDRLADALYGGHRICAAVQRGNIIGVQFHPEKSGEAGLSILRTFLDNCPA